MVNFFIERLNASQSCTLVIPGGRIRRYDGLNALTSPNYHKSDQIVYYEFTRSYKVVFVFHIKKKNQSIRHYIEKRTEDKSENHGVYNSFLFHKGVNLLSHPYPTAGLC